MNNKIVIIKLNASWLPIGFTSIKKAMPDMAAGSSKGLHLAFETDDNGDYNFDSPTEAWPATWDEWIQLPIRPYDDYIQTVSRRIRIPRVVISSHQGMPTIQPKLTKQAIFDRDGYQCAYTGDKFDPRDAHKHLNIDHVIPRHQGGRSTWENMVTSRKDVNTFKDSRTPEQAGLKLRKKPGRPASRTIASSLYRNDPSEVDAQWRWLFGTHHKDNQN